jgi:hypothetical protein
MTGYWYRNCPICEQGRLFVEIQDDSKKAFLTCEECYSSWDAPQEVGVKKSYLALDIGSHRANDSEFEKTGWRDMRKVE